MIRISLDDLQARRLEQAFLQATDRKIRDRLQVIRMAQRGRSHRDIAADLGVSPRRSIQGVRLGFWFSWSSSPRLGYPPAHATLDRPERGPVVARLEPAPR